MASPAETLARARYKTAGLWLFILPSPLIVDAIWSLAIGEGLRAAIVAILYAVYAVAGVITRVGIQREVRPRREDPLKWLPMKLPASIIVGVATFFVASLAVGHGFIASIVFGVGAWAGHVLAYGLDHSFGRRHANETQILVRETLEEAGEALRTLKRLQSKLRHREYRERVRNLVKWGDRILDDLREDAVPASLRRARQFLNIYLDGAKRVTEKYVSLRGVSGGWGGTDSAAVASSSVTDAASGGEEGAHGAQVLVEFEQTQIRSGLSDDVLDENFSIALKEMERVFEEQYHKLQRQDRLDLDVELELLTQQMKRDGVM